MMNSAPFHPMNISGAAPHSQQATALQPKPNRSIPTAVPAPVRFGGTSNYQKVLNQLDFREMGTSFVNQIKVVYAMCIGWRLIAANERRKDSPLKSWNEVRENALRDSMGFAFWFFATPLLQRGVLWGITKKYDPSIGEALYQKNETLANEKGLLGKLKAWNPLYSVNIPTSEQVHNQKEQALHHLKKKGFLTSDSAYHTTEAFYKKLLMYRNVATAMGLLNTIALIGIGINLFNFYLTNKNMECRKQTMLRPTFPPPPVLPKPSLSSQSPPVNQTQAPALRPYPFSQPNNRLA